MFHITLQEITVVCFFESRCTTCTWSCGWFWHNNFQVAVRFSSQVICFSSNFEEVANLLCPQVNSASYPERDGKWEVAYGLRGDGLVWVIRAVICLLAANSGSNCSLTQAVYGRIVHCGSISSCQSVVTLRLLSASGHKSDSFISTFKRTFTFTFELSIFIGSQSTTLAAAAVTTNTGGRVL